MTEDDNIDGCHIPALGCHAVQRFIDRLEELRIGLVEVERGSGKFILRYYFANIIYEQEVMG